jgi:hypothetical protein
MSFVLSPTICSLVAHHKYSCSNFPLASLPGVKRKPTAVCIVPDG